jgi:hypothetical protein
MVSHPKQKSPDRGIAGLFAVIRAFRGLIEQVGKVPKYEIVII